MSSPMSSNRSTIPATSTFDTNAFNGPGVSSTDTPVQTPTTRSPPLRASKITNTADFRIIASSAPALFTLFYFAIARFSIANLDARFVLSLALVLVLSYLLGHEQNQFASEKSETVRLLDAARIKGEMVGAEMRRKDVQLQEVLQLLNMAEGRVDATATEIEDLRRGQDSAKREVRGGRGVGTPTMMPMVVFGSKRG